jgi:DeoR family transcriptional regulator of aga operon
MTNLQDRHDLILSLLRDKDHVSVSELSSQAGVSEVTIRKDLRALEGRGLLRRTHGGAHLRNPYVSSPPLQERAGVHADEKRRIGAAAAALVDERDSIIIGSGTTMTHLVRHLPISPLLTIVTGSLNVALEVARLGPADVLVLGGMLRPSSASVVGPHAEAMLRDTACDKLFLGVDGFDLDFGLTTSNALQATLSEAMIAAAEQVIVLADASKFGHRGFRRICSADVVDCVVTDDAIEDEMVARLQERGIRVEVA